LLKPFHEGEDPSNLKDWDGLRDDLIKLADEHGWKGIVGMGHSLGSTVTMMAAIKRPDIFSRLIIIEPPCIDQIFFRILSVIPYVIAKNVVPPSKVALKRRHKWPSRENAFDLLRSKKIFNNWSDRTLHAYLKYGLEEDENGEYRLRYSKNWESKIYCTIQNPYKLFPKISVPCLCVRAGESDVINEKNWQKWKEMHKNAQFVNIPGSGHLLPMEKPKVIADLIKQF